MTLTKLLYTRHESCALLSISLRSLDYLLAAKSIKVKRVGVKVLIPQAELLRFAQVEEKH